MPQIIHPPTLVDVIFLDIDGVLLPFGGMSNGCHHNEKSCIFPSCTMDALTKLMHDIYNISCNNTTTTTTTTTTIQRGNPVLVLSSTWRARPEFIQDILSSFRDYVDSKSAAVADDEHLVIMWKESSHLDSFFDIVDPNYHSTRRDEIYKWVNEHIMNTDNTNGGKKNNNLHQKSQNFKVRSWIALDDEDLVNVEGIQHDDTIQHAVQTESSVGLTFEDAKLGLQLIEKQIRNFH